MDKNLGKGEIRMSTKTKLFILLTVLVVVIAGVALFSATSFHVHALSLFDSASEMAGHVCVSTCSG